jgi:arginine transport system substrate-binding protein
MVLDIKYGKSLAMIVEPQVAARFIGKNPELKKLELALPKDFQTFGMGICFAKNNALTKKVKTLVQNMRNDGTLQALEKKWDLETKEAK